MKKYNFLLGFIIISALLLRLFRLSELFYYTMDEELYSFIIKRIIVNHHFTLIGNITPLGIHLPPYYFYFSAVPFLLGNLNPLIWGIWGAFLTTFAVFMIYKAGKEIFNEKTGILAAFFMAFSWQEIFFDRHYWALTLNPLYSLLTIFSLWKIIKGKKNYIYLLLITLILGISSDPSNAVLIVFTVLTWIIFKITVKDGKTVIVFSLFLLSFLPLFAFELRHNFYNSRAFLRFLKTPHSQSSFSFQKMEESFKMIPQTLSRSFFVFGDLNLAKQHSFCFHYRDYRLFGIPFWQNIISSFLIFIFIFWGFFKTHGKEKRGIKLLLVLFSTTAIMLVFYAGKFKPDLYEQYLTPIFPFYFLMTAFVVGKISDRFHKLPVLLFIIFFLFFNLFSFFKTYNSLGYSKKLAAVSFAISETGNYNFSLESLGSCFSHQGYRYLFYLSGKEPVKSFMDEDFNWLYDKEGERFHPERIVVFISFDPYGEPEKLYEKYNRYLKRTIKRQKFGGLEVLVVDNSDNYFNQNL